MQAGKYYVGDLCYVLPQDIYDTEFIPIYCNRMSVRIGEWNLASGPKIAVYSTAYGDGTYRDKEGRSYLVDAGLIGCILVNDLVKLGSSNLSGEGGNIIDFVADFNTEYDNGKIVMGPVSIDTDPKEDDWYDDEDEDY